MDQYTFIIKKELRFINRKVNIINIYIQFYQNKKNAYIYGFGGKTRDVNFTGRG